MIHCATLEGIDKNAKDRMAINQRLIIAVISVIEERLKPSTGLSVRN